MLTAAEAGSPDLRDDEIAPRRAYAGSALQRFHREQNEAALARHAYEEEHRAEHAALYAHLAAARKVGGRTLRTALVRFHAGKRRAARLQRTPAWANLEAIRAIYAEAHRLTIETGVPHHVDHELPLQGALVSGLHVETNLRVLPAAANIAKSNRFEPC